MSRLQYLALDELDQLLLAEREMACRSWPYTGTNDLVREIEAEYIRRDEPLPEKRA